jgi:hypothetical protein
MRRRGAFSSKGSDRLTFGLTGASGFNQGANPCKQKQMNESKMALHLFSFIFIYFSESILFNGLRAKKVTGANSRASRAECRESNRQPIQMTRLLTSAFPMLQLRAREFAPVTDDPLRQLPGTRRFSLDKWVPNFAER